jgi:cytochrome c
MHRMLMITIMSIFLSASVGQAGEDANRNAAIEMVKRIQDKFIKDGAETTFKSVTDPSIQEFHVGDLDPFISDLNGLIFAGAQRSLIGKNMIDIKDPDGKYPVRMMINIANGPVRGWVIYKWINPRTKKIQQKTTYIEKMGDYFVGAGIYLE